MMQQFKKISAFTLIELLFIVVIFGIVLALVTSSYQQRTLNVKIEKTALEMQQITQAALAFYTDNNRWPNQQTDQALFSSYLPGNTVNPINPWGKAYIYQPYGSGSLQIISGDLPSMTIAMRLLSLLPNSSLLPDPNTSFTEVSMNIPPSSQKNSFMIAQIDQTGKVNNGVQGNVYFQCPANMPYAAIVGVPSAIWPAYYPTYFVNQDPKGTINYCPGGSGPIGRLFYNSFDSSQTNTFAPNCATVGTSVGCNYTIVMSAHIPAFGPQSASVYTYYCGVATDSGGTFSVNFSRIAWCSTTPIQ